jgi:hypothetical protein
MTSKDSKAMLSFVVAVIMFASIFGAMIPTGSADDTTPPETAITGGPSGTITYNDVTFTWTGSDDVTNASDLVYQYKLGDTWSGWVSGTSVTYTGLSNGDYTFMVKAKDEAGTEDPTPAGSSFTVLVNQPPYTPSSPNPADGASGQSITADLSWTGGDPDAGDTVTYDVYFGTSSSPSFVTTESDPSYDPGTLSYGITYYWQIVAKDNHGASTSGLVWDFTTGAAPNNPPYTPSSPNPADHATGQSITADLSWTGGDPDAGDTVTYDVYFGTSASPSFVTTKSNPSYDPGVLSDGTKYYWKIVATDNHGTFTSGPVWDFTTVADTAPPDTWITAGPSEGETITYNDVTFTWTGSDDVTETSDLVYRYKLADGWSDWTPTTSVVYIDLSNGAYTFTVEAKDQAGKVDSTPATRSFTVSVDKTRPETVITAGPSGIIEYNEVTFIWTGTDDRTDTSDLVYQYKYKTSDAWPETWTTGTSVTKVLSNGAYTFMVRAKDEAGNIDSTPATRSFTVSVDTTPPETAITAGPSGTIDYNEVTFTWTGADDITATANLEYQYTLSDTWLEEWIDGTNVTYTDLPNGDYTFRVRARDEAGAVDPTPAMRSFTVFVDTIPPDTNITVGPSGTIDDNNVTFEWTGTDDKRRRQISCINIPGVIRGLKSGHRARV